MEIFKNAGFDIDVIGQQKPKICLKHWRKAYEAHGKAGLFEERRGKGSTGRKYTRELTSEEKLEHAEARIKFFEAENDFLKR